MRNPYDGEASRASTEAVDADVRAARAGQPEWWRVTNLEKGRLFHTWADLIRDAVGVRRRPASQRVT